MNDISIKYNTSKFVSQHISPLTPEPYVQLPTSVSPLGDLKTISACLNLSTSSSPSNCSTHSLPLPAGGSAILPIAQDKNLGVVPDSSPSLTSHVPSIRKPCQLCLLVGPEPNHISSPPRVSHHLCSGLWIGLPALPSPTVSSLQHSQSEPLQIDVRPCHSAAHAPAKASHYVQNKSESPHHGLCGLGDLTPVTSDFGSTTCPSLTPFRLH